MKQKEDESLESYLAHLKKECMMIDNQDKICIYESHLVKRNLTLKHAYNKTSDKNSNYTANL